MKKNNTCRIDMAHPRPPAAAKMGKAPRKSFIIQGFEDFCGVQDADLRLPLR
jgi:hypothetical protein